MSSHSSAAFESQTYISPRIVPNDFLSPRSSISAPSNSQKTATRILPVRKKEASLMQDSLRSRFRDKTHKLECNDAEENWTYHRYKDFEAKDPLERRLLEQGITPVYDPKHKEVPWYRQVVPDILDLRVFLNAPGPKAGCFQCHIYRKHEPNMLYSRYKLCLSDKDRFLLSARKRKKSKTSNYAISLDESDISNKTGNYFGKLRSNFMGTEFLIYDRGERPSLDCGKRLSSKKVRTELGGVMYHVNRVFGRGHQRMTAVIPALTEELKPHIFQPLAKGSSTILQKYKSGRDLGRMTILRSKHNSESRHTRSSKRNFQLVTESARSDIALQFTKVDKNIYTMEYRYPLSVFQAFAVCLSSLDHK